MLTHQYMSLTNGVINILSTIYIINDLFKSKHDLLVYIVSLYLMVERSMYSYTFCIIFMFCLVKTGYFDNLKGTAIASRIEPYVFISKNGTPTGIMFDINIKLNKYCPVYGLLTYDVKPIKNYTTFLNTLKYDYLVNLTKTKQHTYWLPVLSPDLQLVNTNFTLYNIFQTSGAFVIVKRNFISLQRKLGDGLYKASIYVVLGNLLAICFGGTVHYLVRSLHLIQVSTQSFYFQINFLNNFRLVLKYLILSP